MLFLGQPHGYIPMITILDLGWQHNSRCRPASKATGQRMQAVWQDIESWKLATAHCSMDQELFITTTIKAITFANWFSPHRIFIWHHNVCMLFLRGRREFQPNTSCVILYFKPFRNSHVGLDRKAHLCGRGSLLGLLCKTFIMHCILPPEGHRVSRSGTCALCDYSTSI